MLTQSTPTTIAKTTKSRAAIYIRVSTEGQEDNYSLGSQEAECRAYAEARGYEVAHVYRDVHSGFDLWDRPQVNAMREAVRRGEVHAVIAYALDRLSRKQTHTGIIAEDCDRAGVELLFVTEEFEKSAVGTFIRNAKAFAAEIEREKFKERSLRGREARKKEGLPLVGVRPLYGYQWQGEKKTHCVPNPETAPIVKRVFAELIAGATLGKIAQRLNDEGIPSPAKRGLWRHGALRHMILHEGYTGGVPTTPALIDANTAATARGIMAQNKARSVRNNRQPERYLLRSGHIVCGYCGKALSTSWERGSIKKGSLFPIYRVGPGSGGTHGRCPSPCIRAEILDEAVWDRMLAIIFNPELELERAMREPDDDTAVADLLSIDKAIEKATKEQARLARSIAKLDDEDDDTPLVAEYQAVGKQLKQHRQERAAIVARHDAWEAAMAQRAQAIAWCQELRAKLADPEMISRNEDGEMEVRDAEVFDFLARNVAKRLQLRNAPYERKRAILALFNVKVRLYLADHAPRYEIFAHIDLSPTLTAYYFPECPTEPLCLDRETGEQFIAGRTRKVVVGSSSPSAPEAGSPPPAPRR